MPETQACEVCGANASCIGSTKFVCKSCSTFYRRTYSQYGTLKCRRNANCYISENERTVCRACRLQKCRNVGLRMSGRNLVVQFNGWPKEDQPNLESSNLDASNLESSNLEFSTNQYPNEEIAENLGNSNSFNTYLYEEYPQENINQCPTQSQNNGPETAEQYIERAQQLMKEFPNQRYRMLSKVVETFRQFERRQRFLSAMHQNKEVVEEMTKLTPIIQAKMESSTAKIACMFVMELLSGCDLTKEQRISVLKSASVQVAMAHKATLNAPRFFPITGDSRVCTFIGLYYDMNDLFAFFPNMPQNLQNIEVIRPICEAGLRATEKGRLLKSNIIEAIFMMALVVFEEVERQLIVNESVSQIRDQLYADFTDYQIEIYNDPIVAGSRLIRLAAMVYENKVMTSSQDEMYTIADIFMPGFHDEYFKYLETGELVQTKNYHPFASDEFIQSISNLGI